MNGGVVDCSANSSGPSIGGSSLVTDANSTLSSGPQSQCTSINAHSYLHLRASPMSFTSTNLSGSSVMDGSSLVQETVQKLRGASVTSQSSVPDYNGTQFNLQKKMRMDMRQEDIFQQQMINQLLHRHDSVQLQGNPRQVPRQQQPQQILQQLPMIQRAQAAQQTQHLRPQFQQQIPPALLARRPMESGLCARRMMQYIYHQHQRPADNPILYWRKFVMEYFAPRSRKRWCLSFYDNVGNNALGVFPRAAADSTPCDICGSKSGKGFEATFEVLPRLNQIHFDHGVVDELLFLDMPLEARLPSGLLILEYARAVQETIYEQVRVIHEGQLRIIFSQELKIITWDFCARRHEEFFPRRLVAPQVNQYLQVAQKYQNLVTENGSAGTRTQDLQANCNMFVAAGRQITRSLDLQALNDMGFSKRFVRCLQIAEVVNSMKDLIEYGRQHGTGPLESLKNYSQQAATTSNKAIGSNSGPTDNFSNNHSNAASVHTTSVGQTTAGLNNYHNLLRSSVGPPDQNSRFQPGSSSSSNGPDQGQDDPFRSPVSSVLANTSPGAPPLQQNNVQAPNINHQQAIQKLLQDMMINKASGNAMAEDGPRISGAIQQGGSRVPLPMSRSNSFRSLGSSSGTGAGMPPCGNEFISGHEASLHFPELDQEIVQEFGESGMYGW